MIRLLAREIKPARGPLAWLGTNLAAGAGPVPGGAQADAGVAVKFPSEALTLGKVRLDVPVVCSVAMEQPLRVPPARETPVPASLGWHRADSG